MKLTRRKWIAATGVMPAMARASARYDPWFSDATQTVEAIRKRVISPVELTQMLFRRIGTEDAKLGAYVYRLEEEALAEAKTAEAALAKRRSLRPLEGVPVNIKESFAVKGKPCTWGLPAFKDKPAPTDSACAERLRRAGAVLLGGTNVAMNLGDWQSFNPVYRTTNNPWDVGRTPGGSSGGSSASLAAGMGFLSVGSDIGGSIRVPAHFCGVYGHKPTVNLVSNRGQLPGGPPGPDGFHSELQVAGPMARSARDLALALRLLGGPDRANERAWKWEMPKPRHTTLRDFRVGAIRDEKDAALTGEVRSIYEKTIEALEKAGVKIDTGWPPGFDYAKAKDTYLLMLGGFLYGVSPPPARDAMRKEFGPAEQDRFGAGALMSHADWVEANFRRLGFRTAWEEYFRTHDVFLMPTAAVPAISHDHKKPMSGRTIATAEGPMNYLRLVDWIVPGTLTGCPVTAAPVGLTVPGLPVGVQIMGAMWDDATPIEFARLMADVVGGFQPPPAFVA